MSRSSSGRPSLASRLNETKPRPRVAEPEPNVQPISIQPLGRHKHVQQFLGVSANTVDKFIREEGLPVIRLGGTVRFDLEAVRAWALRRQIQKVRTEGQEKSG